MKGPRHSKDAAGFSLLEALVALALTGIIIGALATITGQWLPNWDRGLARVQKTDNLALGLERVVADLSATEFVSARQKTAQPLFEGLEHSVTFVRTGLAPNASLGLEIVRIAEIGTGRSPELVRTRAPFSPVAEGQQQLPKFGDPVVLVRAPYVLSFAYAGPDRLWRNLWREEAQLPRSIRVSVRDAITGQTLGASTAAVVHAEIPARCITSKSLADCFDSLKTSGLGNDNKAQAANAGRLP